MIIDKSEEEELFFMLSGSLDKEQALKLTNKISIYIEELYKERLKTDITIFEGAIKMCKDHIEEDPYVTFSSLAQIKTLLTTRNIWAKRLVDLNNNIIDKLKSK